MNEESPLPLPTKKRPFFFVVLCIFSLVYFFIFSFLFIAGFFFSGWVAEALNVYAPLHQYPQIQVQILLATLSFFFVLGFSGVIVMWNLRRYGYYLFGISCLLLASVQLLRPEMSLSGTIGFIVLLFLFGLYFRRFR